MEILKGVLNNVDCIDMDCKIKHNRFNYKDPKRTEKGITLPKYNPRLYSGWDSINPGASLRHIV